MNGERTPGPWAVWGSLYEGFAAAVVSGHAPGAELKTVAEVRDYRDAHVLGAALDLLAALEPFEDIAGEGTEDYGDDERVTVKCGRSTFYALTLGDLRRVQAAIAKAEGL